MNAQYQKSDVPWGAIEPKIKSLVEVIHVQHITIWSCEGHIGGGRLPYPWVDLSGRDIDELENRLDGFNSKSEIAWVLYPHWEHVIGNKQKIYRLMPKCELELSKYHEYLINDWKLKQQEEGLKFIVDPDILKMITEFHLHLKEDQKHIMDLEELKKLENLANTCPSLETLQESANDLATYLKEWV